MKTIQQFILFASIGAIGTMGHYAVLILLVQLMHTNPVFATTNGFIVGALINYMLNYRITFNCDKRHSESLTKFLIVACFGGIMNAGIMKAGITLLDINYLAIQVVATCFVLLLNFIANKYWTFAG